MTQAPRVSIVIPTSNSATYLAPTIESVCTQTVADWELVLFDDGSSDGTVELAEALAKGDPRIRIVRRDHGGIAAARNGWYRQTHPESEFLTLPMAEARGFSRPAGEAHRASAPAPAGSALRDGSAPPEADDGCGGGMVLCATDTATAAASVAQTQEAALSPRLKPGACAPQEKVRSTRYPSGILCGP